MNLNALKALDSADLARLIELAVEYRSGVASGDITGFPNDYRAELAETDALIAKLRAAL